LSVSPHAHQLVATAEQLQVSVADMPALHTVQRVVKISRVAAVFCAVSWLNYHLWTASCGLRV